MFLSLRHYTAAPKKAAAPAEPKISGVKYSKRGKISTQTGGQISKAQYKKIQQATSEAKAKQEEMEEKVRVMR